MNDDSFIYDNPYEDDNHAEAYDNDDTDSGPYITDGTPRGRSPTRQLYAAPAAIEDITMTQHDLPSPIPHQEEEEHNDDSQIITQISTLPEPIQKTIRPRQKSQTPTTSPRPTIKQRAFSSKRANDLSQQYSTHARQRTVKDYRSPEAKLQAHIEAHEQQKRDAELQAAQERVSASNAQDQTMDDSYVNIDTPTRTPREQQTSIFPLTPEIGIPPDPLHDLYLSRACLLRVPFPKMA